MDGHIPDDKNKPLSVWDAATRAESDFGIPKGLLRGLGMEESNGLNHWDESGNLIKSNTGATGAFQFTRGTAKHYNVNRDDPMENIVGAARLMKDNYAAVRHLVDDDKDAWMAAAIAHNRGLGAVQKMIQNRKFTPGGVDSGNGGDTVKYATRIADNWAKLGGGENTFLPTPTVGNTTEAAPEVPSLSGGAPLPVQYATPENLQKLGLQYATPDNLAKLGLAAPSAPSPTFPNGSPIALPPVTAPQTQNPTGTPEQLAAAAKFNALDNPNIPAQVAPTAPIAPDAEYLNYANSETAAGRVPVSKEDYAAALVNVPQTVTQANNVPAQTPPPQAQSNRQVQQNRQVPPVINAPTATVAATADTLPKESFGSVPVTKTYAQKPTAGEVVKDALKATYGDSFDTVADIYKRKTGKDLFSPGYSTEEIQQQIDARYDPNTKQLDQIQLAGNTRTKQLVDAFDKGGTSGLLAAIKADDTARTPKLPEYDPEEMKAQAAAFRGGIAEDIRKEIEANRNASAVTDSGADFSEIKVTDADIDRRIDELKRAELTPAEKRESLGVADYYNSLVGTYGSAALSSILSAGGKGLATLGGIARVAGDNPVSSYLERQSKKQEYAAEKMGDNGYVSKGIKLVGGIADFPRIILLSDTPLGAVGGFAVSGALESAGKGESGSKILSAGKEGAAQGLLFGAASSLGSFVGKKVLSSALSKEAKELLTSPAMRQSFEASKAAGESPILNPDIRRALIKANVFSETTRLGSIFTGTTAIGLAKGDSLSDSAASAVQMTMFDFVMHHAAKLNIPIEKAVEGIKGKVFNVVVGKEKMSVVVDGEGNIDGLKNVTPGIVDATVVADKQVIDKLQRTNTQAKDVQVTPEVYKPEVEPDKPFTISHSDNVLDLKPTNKPNEAQTELQKPQASVVQGKNVSDAEVPASETPTVVKPDSDGGKTTPDGGKTTPNATPKPQLEGKSLENFFGKQTPAPVKEGKIVTGGEINRDVQRRMNAERAAEQNPMTKLPNKAAFEKALPTAEADPNTSVIVFDANNFGSINKQIGHQTGDAEIKRFGAGLKQAASEFGYGERVFHFGGDEFVTLAPKDVAAKIRDRAEEIVGTQTFKGKNNDVTVSISGEIGNTFADADGKLQARKAAKKAELTQTAVETGKKVENLPVSNDAVSNKQPYEMTFEEFEKSNIPKQVKFTKLKGDGEGRVPGKFTYGDIEEIAYSEKGGMRAIHKAIVEKQKESGKSINESAKDSPPDAFTKETLRENKDKIRWNDTKTDFFTKPKQHIEELGDYSAPEDEPFFIGKNGKQYRISAEQKKNGKFAVEAHKFGSQGRPSAAATFIKDGDVFRASDTVYSNEKAAGLMPAIYDYVSRNHGEIAPATTGQTGGGLALWNKNQTSAKIADNSTDNASPLPETAPPQPVEKTNESAAKVSDALPDSEVPQAEQAKLDKANKIAEKKPRKPQTADPKKHSLSQFIKLSGGIRPSKVIDLAAIRSAQPKDKRGQELKGFAATLRDSGRNIEDVFRDAVESGYLTGLVDPQNFNGKAGANAFSIDDFVRLVADDMLTRSHMSAESGSLTEESIAAQEADYYAKKAEQEKSEADADDLTDEEFYGVKTVEDFLDDPEVKQILLNSEKRGSISDKDRNELFQIGHYDKGLAQPVVREAVSGLERAISERQNQNETPAETQPATDGENAPNSDSGSQSPASELYRPEPADDFLDESEPDGEVDDSFDFSDEESAPTESSKVPDNVLNAVKIALNSVRDAVEGLERARETDKQQNGGGRYEAEVWKNRELENYQLPKTLQTFIEKSLDNNINAQKVFDELGGLPKVELSAQGKKYFSDIAETTPKPQQNSFDQTDLFGNKVTPKTEQTGLFGASDLPGDTQTVKQELTDAYGKKTADYISQLGKSPDKDISRAARDLSDARKLVAAKGDAAKRLVEDAADALDLFTLAKQQKSTVAEVLTQPRIDGVTFSKDARTLAKAMEAGKFAAAFGNELSKAKTEIATVAPGSVDPNDTQAIAQSFADEFNKGAAFASITQARKHAETITGKKILPGTDRAKRIDEAIEVGVVLAARQIVEDGRKLKLDDRTIFESLVDLYRRQPGLNVRTSTSISQQAYSTPAPLAFAASRLARIGQNTKVYEPTAGNGILLLEAAPDGNVYANELNADRHKNLQAQFGESEGEITGKDATAYAPDAKTFAAVIANPPFGVVKGDDGQSIGFRVNDQYKTNDIDHAIVFKSLEAMKDDGRAVFIVGSVVPKTETERSKAYNGLSKKKFYYSLYNEYNVTQHFTVDGSLYSKQGASFPVDVIVIEGRGKSARPLPAAQVPETVKSWADVWNKVNDYETKRGSISQDAVNSVDAADSLTDGQNGGGDSLAAGTADERGSISAPARRQSSVDDTGVGKPGKRSELSKRNTDERAVDTNSDNSAELGGKPADIQSANAKSDVAPGNRDEISGAGVAEQSAGGKDTTRNKSGKLDGRADVSAPPERTRVNLTESDQTETGQIDYKPFSKGRPMVTKVPVGLYNAVAGALEKVEADVGSIDAYVAEKLGYGDHAELLKHFGGEQIDALALALHNAESGKGFIIGDQTGIGKGRVVAGMFRYAMAQGYTPIFVTEKPNLYADIIRDMKNIGTDNIKPFMTNAGAKIPLNAEETEFLTSSGDKKHKQEVADITAAAQLPDHYNIVFTSYSQMQSLGTDSKTGLDRPLPRREMLDAIMPNAFIVLDESHNAGGAGEGKIKKRGAAPDRADFVREMIGKAKGVLYSSATYAKRPNVMSLYSATDMNLAVPDGDSLSEAIEAGGVPLQQVVASMLAESGQYIRRERDFEGISYDTVDAAVNRETAEVAASVMRAVKEFDDIKNSIVGKLSEDAKADAKSIAGSAATGAVGMQSSNFTSLMHNLTAQMLLTLKADAAAGKAIEQLKQGNKPVITVSNTMGSFIQHFVEENGITPGDEVKLSFGDMMRRYLSESRKVIEGDPFGKKTSRYLSDEELGTDAMNAYGDALEIINGADWSKMPVSPIDYITNKLQKAGYSVGEITGRTQALDYSSGKPVYRPRQQSDISATGRVKTINKFNSGETHAMILNQAGSTGLSLHASKDFADQSKRVMIIAQAELNIDTHMQMLGRVNRTGQVIKPSYLQLVADIPAELRPAAILAKKMASLNASTTASRDSAVTAKTTVDFINEYGDLIVYEMMLDNVALHAQLGNPLLKGDTMEMEGAARKVTGILPILPLAQQEEIYEEITSSYTSLVDRLNQLGENKLEAQTLDLKAKTLSRTEVFKGKGASPFEQGAHSEEVEAQKIGKPFSSAQITKAVQERIGTDETDPAKLLELGYAKTTEFLKELAPTVAKFTEDAIAKAKTDERRTEVQSNLRNAERKISSILRTAHIGALVELDTGVIGNQTGIVADIRKKKNGSPLALSGYEVVVYTTNAMRQMVLPLSQVATSQYPSASEHAVTIAPARREFYKDGKLSFNAFDEGASTATERRTIITGNLLAGFGAFSQGRIINYTTAGGEIKQGILMPKEFQTAKAMDEMPVRFSDASHVLEFLKNGAQRVVTNGEGLNISSYQGNVTVNVPASKAQGGVYFLNKGLIEAAGKDFVKSGNTMRLSLDGDFAIKKFIDEVLAQDWRLQTNAFKDDARRITGQELAKKEIVNESGNDSILRKIADNRTPEHITAQNTLRQVADKASLLKDVEAIQKGSSVRLSLEAGEIARFIQSENTAQNLGDIPNIDGLHLDAHHPDGNQVTEFTDVLDKIANTVEARGGDRTTLDNLSKAVTDAASGNGTAILHLYNEAEAHETTHQASTIGARENGLSKTYLKRYKNADEIIKDADFQVFHKALEKTENRRISGGVALEEALAYLGNGDFARFGLSKDQAKGILKKLIRGYYEANGAESLKNFSAAGISAIHAEIEELHNENETTIEAGKGESRQIGDESGGGGTQAREIERQGIRPAAGQASGRSGSETESAAEKTSVDEFTPSGGQKASNAPKTLRDAGIPVADRFYTGVTNEAQKEFADRQLDKGTDAAVKWLNEQIDDGDYNSGATTAVGLTLLQKLGSEGKFAEMNAVADRLVPMLTEAGQAIQAMALVSMHRPESAGAYAAKVKKQSTGTDLTEAEHQKAIDLAKELSETAKAEGLAKALLEEANQKLTALEAEKADIESSLKSASSKNDRIKLKLDDAARDIRNLKAKIARLESLKPAAVRRIPQHKLLTELKTKESDILARIKAQYGDAALRMTAWHGSPHLFDKFSTEHLLKGEGANVYGAGLYFTDKESIADHYRQALSLPSLKFGGKSIDDAEFTAKEQSLADKLQSMVQNDESLESGIDRMVSDVQRYTRFARGIDATSDSELNPYFEEIKKEAKTPELAQEAIALSIKMVEGDESLRTGDKSTASWDRLLEIAPNADHNVIHDVAPMIEEEKEIEEIYDFYDKYKDDIKIDKGGAKYKVDLKPDQDEYLLWDKPLSEQSEKVKKALKSQQNEAVVKKYAELTKQLNDLDFAGKSRSQEFDDIAEESRKLRRDNPFLSVDLKDGRTIYEDIKSQKGAKEASEYLKSLGVRGVKYLDGSSRDAKQEWIAKHPLGGENAFNDKESAEKFIAKYPEHKLIQPKPLNYNYVIFDDSDVSIDEILRSTPPANHQDLIDWSTLTLLENLPKGKMSVADFYDNLDKLTGGTLSPEEIRDIHASAVSQIKTSSPRTDEQLAAAKNRAEHYKEATAHEKRYETELDNLVKEYAAKVKAGEKANKPPDAFTTALIKEGVGGDYSDEAIFAALARKTFDPEEVINKLKTEFPDLTQEQTRRALIDGNDLTKRAAASVRSLAIEVENDFKLTTADVQRIKDERAFNSRESARASRAAQTFYDGLTKSKKRIAAESLVNFRRANLLTAPLTHIRNIVANAAMDVGEEASRLIASIADIAAATKTGERTVQGVSPKGVVQGFKNIFKSDETLKNMDVNTGLERAKEIMIYGDTADNMNKQQFADANSKLVFGKVGAVADAYMNFVFRTMGAEDAMFKVYAFRRSLEEQAHVIAKTEARTDSSVDVKKRRAELLADPTAVMQVAAHDYADFATFQDSNAVSSAFSKAKNVHPVVKTAAELAVPFDKTPTNIVLRVLDNTPLGFVRAGVAARKGITKNPAAVQKFNNRYRGAVEADLTKQMNAAGFADLPKKQQRELIDEQLGKLFTRQQQHEFARSFGRAATGSALTIPLGFALASIGLLAGIMNYDPDDKDETSEFFNRKRAGVENKSLRVPGVGRFVTLDDPYSKSLILGATIYEQMQLAEKQKKDALGAARDAVSESFTDAVFEQPLLSNVRDMFGKSQPLGARVGNMLSGFVPGAAIVGAASEVTDDKARKAGGYSAGEAKGKTTEDIQWTAFRNSFFRRIPGARNSLVDESTSGVSPMERGGMLRRAVRSFDVLNTRSDVPYEVGSLPSDSKTRKTANAKPLDALMQEMTEAAKPLPTGSSAEDYKKQKNKITALKRQMTESAKAGK